MKISQIKKYSKNLIKGSVKKSSVILILFLLVMIVFSALPFFVNLFLGNNKILTLVILCCILLPGAAAFSAFKTAAKAWFLFYHKNKRGVKALFWFRLSKSLGSMGLYFSLFIRKLMWSVVFLLPGIGLIFAAVILAADGGIEFNLFATWVAGGAALLLCGIVFLSLFFQRYFLVPYLRAMNPSEKHREIFRKSRAYMNGNVKKAYALKLSFIPQFMACLTVFPVFYVWTYYSQSCAVMAKRICVEKNQRTAPLKAQSAVNQN